MSDSLHTSRARRAAPRIVLPFGQPCDHLGAPRSDAPAIAWASASALNGHVLVAGGSGSGKTHQLRRVVTTLARGSVVTHVIDVHGDLDVPGAHTVKFSASTEFGLNPLEVSPDPDFGGPRNRTLAFVATLRRLTQLGERQKTALIRLITDLYRAYGFEQGDRRSWSLDHDPRTWAKTAKRFPHIGDLKEYTLRKLKSMKFGIDKSAVTELDKLAREIRKFNSTRVDVAKGDKDRSALATQREKCVEAFAKGLEKLETGDEIDDLLAWDSVDAVKGLYDRIESLEACGVFRGKRPDFPAGATLLRYDISALQRAEQQLFVDTLLADIFFKAKQRGEADGLLEAVAIDEASIFIDDDKDHIIDIVFREARKFGLGVILASQSLTHMTESQISSACVKLVLGVDEMFHQKMEARLGLPRGKLKFIRPKKTALVQVKASGDLSNKFHEVRVID